MFKTEKKTEKVAPTLKATVTYSQNKPIEVDLSEFATEILRRAGNDYRTLDLEIKYLIKKGIEADNSNSIGITTTSPTSPWTLGAGWTSPEPNPLSKKIGGTYVAADPTFTGNSVVIDKNGFFKFYTLKTTEPQNTAKTAPKT